MARFRIIRPDLEPTEIVADHSSFADSWFTFWADAAETEPLLLVRRDEGARIEELPPSSPDDLEPASDERSD